MPCHRLCPWLLLAVALIGGGSRSAHAALMFSFDTPSYAIANVGGTANVGLYVAQIPGTSPAITATNPLLTGGLQISFATTGAAIETNFIASPRWDNSSVASATSGSNTVVSLTVLSLAGITDLSSPLLLGTFTFTGRSLGATTVLAATIHPGVNFIDLNGDNLDPSNTPTAMVRVGSAASVPEPLSLTLLLIGCGSVGLRGRGHRHLNRGDGRMTR